MNPRVTSLAVSEGVALHAREEQSWETALAAPHSTFPIQTSGEHPVGHASPTIFSCSGFYLVMAPIGACHVAAPPEAI